MGIGRCILLTPPGGAAIAVVRIAGDGVGAFLRDRFDQPVREGRCVHGTLADGGRVVDDPVVVLSAGGRVADVSLHGGPWVVRSVMELARRAGFETGEAPALPIEAGTLDAGTELGREVLRYLPLAQTELAVRTLLGQEVAWERFKQSSPSADDVGSVLLDRSLYWLLHPPRVAIVGVPNAGKSTLANRLFGQERSITADVPGTTRDWVGEIANLDGLAVTLVDTPGLRRTADAIEAESVKRAREVIRSAHLVVLVLDPTVDGRQGQAALLGEFGAGLYVMNKSDLPAVWTVNVPLRPTYAVSAATGAGVDELREAIRGRFIATRPGVPERPRVWTLRQRRILARAVQDRSALAEI